jgi:hypothetical protein
MLDQSEKQLIHQDVRIHGSVELNSRHPEKSAPQSFWREFLSSTVVASLITVGIGGVAGQVLISKYQNAQKQNELAHEHFRQYVEMQQSVIQDAVNLVSDTEFDANALISLSKPRFKNLENNKEVQGQISSLINAHTTALKKWNAGRRKMALLLHYYCYGRSDVSKAWGTIADAVDAHMNCAQRVYSGTLPDGDCREESKKIEMSLEQLSAALENVRQESWNIVELPRVPK